MYKKTLVGILLSIFVFILDQTVKNIFINGFRWSGEYFSLVFVLNKGVAFSMLDFLGEWLKYIQAILLVFFFGYLAYERKFFQKYWLPVCLIFGAGVSNLYDRFLHGGVVDYFYWHYGFRFAVFNLADVVINIAVVLSLFIYLKKI